MTAPLVPAARERGFSCFIAAHSPVDDTKVEAEFYDGVLTVKLPKTEASKTRTVKVKNGGN